MANNNLPAVRGPEQALNLVQKHRSQQDLIFVAEEDLRTQSMFLPEVVVIHSTPDDFHNISGNFMPKGHQMDRIGEAAGIVFLEKNCGTRAEKVDGETAYVGFAQGKKRMPDGTWRISSICEYEFNPSKRAEEDILRDTKAKYKEEKERKLLLLNYKKFGRQRASTGARLRIVRELTGMPISFKPDQIKRAMVFSRVAINTDMLLSDPEMREAAVKAALGASENIYGPKPDQYQVENGQRPAQIENHTEEEEIPFGPPTKKSPEEEEIESSLAELKKLSEIPYLHKDAKSFAEDILTQEKPSLDAINHLIEQIKEWLNNPQVVQKHGRYKEEAVK
jgi:hypothetical protein